MKNMRRNQQIENKMLNEHTCEEIDKISNHNLRRDRETKIPKRICRELIQTKMKISKPMTIS